MILEIQEKRSLTERMLCNKCCQLKRLIFSRNSPHRVRESARICSFTDDNDGNTLICENSLHERMLTNYKSSSLDEKGKRCCALR